VEFNKAEHDCPPLLGIKVSPPSQVLRMLGLTHFSRLIDCCFLPPFQRGNLFWGVLGWGGGVIVDEIVTEKSRETDP
jgi:hypothetical protein